MNETKKICSALMCAVCVPIKWQVVPILLQQTIRDTLRRDFEDKVVNLILHESICKVTAIKL